jgi:hypothetical protein
MKTDGPINGRKYGSNCAQPSKDMMAYEYASESDRHRPSKMSGNGNRTQVIHHDTPIEPIVYSATRTHLSCTDRYWYRLMVHGLCGRVMMLGECASSTASAAGIVPLADRF